MIQIIFSEHSKFAPFFVKVEKKTGLLSPALEKCVQAQTLFELSQLGWSVSDAAKLSVNVLANLQDVDMQTLNQFTAADFVRAKGTMLVEVTVPDAKSPLFYDAYINKSRVMKLVASLMADNKQLREQLKQQTVTTSTGARSLPTPPLEDSGRSTLDQVTDALQALTLRETLSARDSTIVSLTDQVRTLTERLQRLAPQNHVQSSGAS